MSRSLQVVVVCVGPPKLIEPPNAPVTITFLLLSTATAVAACVAQESPACLLHRHVPAELSLAMYTSEPPRLVCGPQPKSTLPWKVPAITTSLLESTATADPSCAGLSP